MSEKKNSIVLIFISQRRYVSSQWRTTSALVHTVPYVGSTTGQKDDVRCISPSTVYPMETLSALRSCVWVYVVSFSLSPVHHCIVLLLIISFHFSLLPHSHFPPQDNSHHPPLKLRPLPLHNPPTLYLPLKCLSQQQCLPCPGQHILPSPSLLTVHWRLHPLPTYHQLLRPQQQLLPLQIKVHPLVPRQHLFHIKMYIPLQMSRHSLLCRTLIPRLLHPVGERKASCCWLCLFLWYRNCTDLPYGDYSIHELTIQSCTCVLWMYWPIL